MEIKDPQWFNKNARVYAQVTKVVTPCGKTVDLNAKPFYKNYELKEGPWMTAGKIALYTVGGAAVGTGAGVGFSFIPDPDKVGTGVAIGTPVGAGLGLITGLITPGVNYKAKQGELIYLLLIDDLNVLNEDVLLDIIENVNPKDSEFLKYIPDNADTLYNLALAYELVGDIERAIKFYKKAI